MSNYDEIIDDLEKSLDDLKKNKIRINSLEEFHTKLKRKKKDISNVEKNLESIRNEIIGPIKIELDYNRKANVFSKMGFWIGSFGLILSVISISSNLYIDRTWEKFRAVNMLKSNPKDYTSNYGMRKFNSDFYELKNDARELLLMQNQLSGEFKPLTEKSFEISWKKRKELLKGNNLNKFEIEAYLFNETENISNNREIVRQVFLRFYKNDEIMTGQLLKNFISISYNNDLIKDGLIVLREGDSFKVGIINEFYIEKINLYNSKSSINKDKKQSVIISHMK